MRHIIIIFIFFSLKLSATHYYVSLSGNDSNTGLSDEQAWLTTDKINSSTFSAGDTISFHNGQLFRDLTYTNSAAGYGGMIRLTEDGSAANHIVFNGYGTGNRPKIFGSKCATSYTHITGNVYRLDNIFVRNPASFPFDGGSSYKGGLFFMINDTVEWADSSVASNAALVKNHDWHWQNDSIYFYWNGNIADIDSIEVEQHGAIFQADGEYYTFDGLEMRYYQRAAVGTSTWPETTVYGLTVKNCYICFSSIREGLVGFGLEVHYSDALIENNDIHNQGRRSISFNITNTTGSCLMRDVIIQDNFLHDGYHTTGVDMGTQGYNHTVRNIVIRRNFVYENPAEAVYKSQFNFTMVFLENNGDEGDWDSIFIYNNAILNSPTICLMLYGVGHSWVINNTFVAFLFNPSGANSGIVLTGSASHTTIMNNIFHIHPNELGLYNSISGDFSNRNAVTWDTVDYNLVSITYNSNHYIAYPPSSWSQVTYNQSDWANIVGYGWETHSLVPPQPPHFADSLVSYKIKASSPAVGAAKHISFVTTDIEGTQRDLIHPDAGAYEYVAESCVTPITALTTTVTDRINDVLGSIAITSVTGGNGSYSYSWSSGGSAATESNIQYPLNDTVTVTDTDGCDYTKVYKVNYYRYSTSLKGNYNGKIVIHKFE